MSSNRIRSTSVSVSVKSHGLLENAIQQKKSIKYLLFHSPRTLQEKFLSFVICVLFVFVTVFVTSLCIMCDRWKATLSQLKHFYIEEDDICETEACQETAKGIISNIDPNTDPCSDFFQYACGGWIEKNPIPKDRNAVLISSQRERQLSKHLFGILKKYATEDKNKSVRNAGKLLSACMNSEARNRNGLKSLNQLIKEFGGWPMLGDHKWDEGVYVWYEKVAKANRELFLQIFVEFDFRQYMYDNSFYVMLIDSGYFIFEYNENNTLSNEKDIKAARDYIVNAARLMGSKLNKDELKNQALEILEFEQKLYEASFDYSDEDIEMTVGYLQANVTDENFSYRQFFDQHFKSDVPVEDDTYLMVVVPNYFRNLPKIVAETKKRTVANYIAFYLFSHFSDLSSDAARKLSVDYDTKVGTARSSNIEKICLSWVKKLMNKAVGRIYVDRYFPELTKMHVKKMLQMISLAYSANIDQNVWMDEQTLMYSLIKLQSIQSMILYEDWIKDDKLLDEYYSKLGEVDDEDFFSAARTLREIQGDVLFSHWNKTAQRNDSDAEMSNPIIINAFYNPSTNFIALPSGIMGYPYYKYGRIDSINYGAIGTVIGHEISHAFDTSGRKYDHIGNRRDWWTNETKYTYYEKANCFIEQYNNFEDPLSSLKTDGQFTLSENIADNGGVKSAFQAFRLHLALSGENLNYRKRLPGLSATPEQLFFLGYASIWCGNMTEEYAASYTKFDSHCPNKIRVNVPLSNFKEFSKAFKCKPGTAMNPIDKCTLW